MTDEQRRQILELSNEFNITLNGYNAEVFPYDENRVIITEVSTIPEEDEVISDQPIKFTIYSDNMVMTYGNFEKQILKNNGQF